MLRPLFTVTLLFLLSSSACTAANTSADTIADSTQPQSVAATSQHGRSAQMLATASSAEQEQPQRVYMQIQYLEVQHASLMSEILSQTLLPFQQKRVDSGDILNWAIYETLISGSNDRYRLISITKTTDYNELFREFSASESYRNLSGQVSMQSMLSFHEVAQVLYSEIWVLEGDAIMPGASTPAGNYITKNYLDSRDRSGEHRSLELNFWRPIHHERIAAGILNGWAMYNLSKPGGSSRRYTYSTIDYYERLGDVAGFDSFELAQKAHPTMSENELRGYFNRTGASRTAWKTELWRRILNTTPTSMPEGSLD